MCVCVSVARSHSASPLPSLSNASLSAVDIWDRGYRAQNSLSVPRSYLGAAANARGYLFIGGLYVSSCVACRVSCEYVCDE